MTTNPNSNLDSSLLVTNLVSFAFSVLHLLFTIVPESLPICSTARASSTTRRWPFIVPSLSTIESRSWAGF